MNKSSWMMVAVAVAAGMIGFLAASHFTRQQSTVQKLDVTGTIEQPAAADLVGQRRPDFSHLDSMGRSVSAADYNGRPLLLNFWASWCKPCVDEMPMLSQLQQSHGAGQLAVVGIALDDADRARTFAAELGLAYPVLVGTTDVVITGRRYGNNTGLLPFSVLVDAQGIIRWTRLGALSREEIEAELAKLQ